eukprot:8218109-Pyramimonas_sp.AAC.1
MGLDFPAISGPKAALITEGAINLDLPNGHVYNHCEDHSIIITLIGTEARAIAAQNVVEHTGARPSNPGRIMLQGEVKHVISPILNAIVDGNWLAAVQQMHLCLRPIRIIARNYQLLLYQKDILLDARGE